MLGCNATCYDKPSKWVDTMKNMHGSHKPDFEPVYKARLVSCGNFEKVEKGEVRCDSPTREPESHLVLASHASSLRWRLLSADITNAYFQSEFLTRLLFDVSAKRWLDAV